MAVPKNKISLCRIRKKKKIKINILKNVFKLIKLCIYCKLSKEIFFAGQLASKNYNVCRGCLNKALVLDRPSKNPFGQ